MKMNEKYWLEKIEEAFKLAENSGTGYEKAEFMKKIFDDLADEKAHHYATKEILQEIAEQIAIELTNIQEAKDEEAVDVDTLKNKIIEYLSSATEVDRDELYAEFAYVRSSIIETAMQQLYKSGIINIRVEKYTGYTEVFYHLNKDMV